MAQSMTATWCTRLLACVSASRQVLSLADGCFWKNPLMVYARASIAINSNMSSVGASCFSGTRWIGEELTVRLAGQIGLSFSAIRGSRLSCLRNSTQTTLVCRGILIFSCPGSLRVIIPVLLHVLVRNLLGSSLYSILLEYIFEGRIDFRV